VHLVHTFPMPERAQILRGPWGSPQQPCAEPSRDASVREDGGRVVLGLVVRECAIALGHDPSARELAEWANHRKDGRGDFCLFGRAISAAEAAVILKHPAREVTVRPERAAPRPGLGLVAMPSRARD